MDNFLDELKVKNQTRSKEWANGADLDPLFSVVEFAGEAGELADAVKKLYRCLNGLRSSMTEEEAREALSEEVGDVMITLDLLCSQFGIDIEEATRDKFNKTSRKYDLSVFLGE